MLTIDSDELLGLLRMHGHFSIAWNITWTCAAIYSSNPHYPTPNRLTGKNNIFLRLEPRTGQHHSLQNNKIRHHQTILCRSSIHYPQTQIARPDIKILLSRCPMYKNRPLYGQTMGIDTKPQRIRHCQNCITNSKEMRRKQPDSLDSVLHD